ncbi:hypothetical protein BDV97DRAFT_369571 [Delphinella strobiligena]|nr:hypothetical protein BDV97DRAFT_369571 [Delphinella strobiligena]
MRTRRSAGNGDSQSSLQDNIDVALPQVIPTSEPPRKRIKLKLFHSSSSFREEATAPPASPRPKRQSSGRVSYAKEEFVTTAVKPPGSMRMSPSRSSLSSPNSQASAERQDMTPSYGAAFLDNYIDDADLSRNDPGVDNLLLAAAGSSPTAEKNLSLLFIGTMDDDMDLLVKNAIQIFRSNLVTKNQLAAHLSGGTARSRGSRKAKGSENGLYNADKERFAMASLERLLDGNALNVNCIISRERVHMMWYLYRQLQSLMSVGDPNPQRDPYFSPGMQAVPMPHLIQPRPASPHQFMQRSQIDSQHQHVDSSPPQSQEHPISPRQPHQFLFTQAYASPYPSAGKVAVQSKQKRPETSNHSSQSTYPEINRIQHGHGIPGMQQNMGPPPFPYVTRFPHAGMAMGTPYGHLPRQSMTPISANGTAMAPNGAFMIASPAGPQGSGGAVGGAED